MGETWAQHNEKLISDFKNWLSKQEEISISEIIDCWKNKYSVSSFSIYIEDVDIGDSFCKISRRQITFGKINSILPASIMYKIRTWFINDVAMNSKLVKYSFNVYSRNKSNLWPFIDSFNSNNKYSVVKIELNEYRSIVITLKKISH